jgi:iron-sulfur cluster assembly protein
MSDTGNATAPVRESFSVTDIARQELLRLRGESRGFLRIWVEEGGCSGMIYRAVIDETPGPFDVEVYEDGELRVVTDAQSLPHVEALHVDYSDDLVEAGFRFINPRAAKSCGCGQSFQT